MNPSSITDTHIVTNYNNLLFNIYVLATFLEKSIVTQSYLPFIEVYPKKYKQNILFSLARTMCTIADMIMKTITSKTFAK